MSNVIPLVINDGLSTPVARTFNVMETDNGYQRWGYTPTGLLLSDQRSLALKHTRAATQEDTATRKDRCIYRQPVRDALGVLLPKGIVIDAVISAPNGASLAEIEDALAFHGNALLVTLVKEQLSGIQNAY